jgi:hypothetical protein
LERCLRWRLSADTSASAWFSIPSFSDTPIEQKMSSCKHTFPMLMHTSIAPFLSCSFLVMLSSSLHLRPAVPSLPFSTFPCRRVCVTLVPLRMSSLSFALAYTQKSPTTHHIPKRRILRQVAADHGVRQHHFRINALRQRIHVRGQTCLVLILPSRDSRQDLRPDHHRERRGLQGRLVQDAFEGAEGQTFVKDVQR